jgi:SAM-dependent methyltransferase
MSLRTVIESLGPKSYTGTDIFPGPGVDEICPAEKLRMRFGAGEFDLVISTETLEHVRDWRAVIANLKQVLKPGGILLITTRSKGFPYHGWPHDYWRYELEDMKAIFGEMEIRVLEPDLEFPGVFLKAVKLDSVGLDLREYRLFSMVKQRRTESISERDEWLFKIAYRPVLWARAITPGPAKRLVKRTGLSKEKRALDRVR